jgi:large subunit ribosomal protein L25
MRLGEGATIRVRVPVRVINSDQSPGIKRGGTVNIVTHTIDVRCLADAIPDAFEVDVAGLEINHSKHLSDIKLPPNVRPFMHVDATLVTIVPPSGYAEEMKAAAEAAPAATPAAGGGEKK